MVGLHIYRFVDTGHHNLIRNEQMLTKFRAQLRCDLNLNR